MTPTCESLRERIVDAARGALEPGELAALMKHVESCPVCTVGLERERATEAVLRSALPRLSAPSALTERLRQTARERYAGKMETKPGRRKRSVVVFGLLSAAILAAAALLLFVRGGQRGESLVAEAVNDHLRILYAQNPLEIAASDQHQVKPWFAGRVDFAPRFTFNGDERFSLSGGAVSVFVDRKAALFVFKHRLHVITFLNFNGDALPWPLTWNSTVGGQPAEVTSRNGFNVILWRDGSLGYVLTSDVNVDELRALAALLHNR